jgi:predicted nuclease of predicted toxin-antitoxin system
MKVFMDENIPSRTVEELRGLGHDVLDIRGTADQGMEDDVLWARLMKERRVMITTDKGFAQHRHEAYHGILMRAVKEFRESEWPGLLVVMRDTVQSVSRAEV